MKRLVLLRHATTEANHQGGDKARGLLPRGLEQAASVGAELAGLGIDYALVSAAIRTRQTFDALGLDVPAEFQEALYHGDADVMLQRISETDESFSGLLVVGHAPTIPTLSTILGSASASREADQLRCGFMPATWAEFTFDGSWADLPDELDGVRLVSVHQA